mgnify:CR=1 FL=1
MLKDKIRIIICGPDLVGKTNIAAELSRVSGVPVYKSGREHKLFNEKDAQYNVLKWGVYEVLRLVEVCDLSIIFDRSFTCEYVYSKVYKRNSDDGLVREYDRWWDSLDGKIVFLDKPKMDGKDELINPEKYDEIRTRYEDYKKITQCKHLTIDTSDYDIYKQVNTIIEFVK